jgi:hypothetical protein
MRSHTRCLTCLRQAFFRAFSSLRRRRFSRLRVPRTRRFSRLRLRQVYVRRCCRGATTKSVAPRTGRRRGPGTNFFRSLVTELLSTSLAG